MFAGQVIKVSEFEAELMEFLCADKRKTLPCRGWKKLVKKFGHANPSH